MTRAEVAGIRRVPFFAIYVLAYCGLGAYGAALLKTGGRHAEPWNPRTLELWNFT